MLKNIALLPSEKFGKIKLQQTVLLKIIYDFRVEISFMEKQKFLISRKLYVFSIAINVFLCSETVWIKRGEGGGLRTWNFQG